MVEFLPYTQAVGGSSPSPRTKFIRMFTLTIKSKDRTFIVKWVDELSFRSFQQYQRPSFIPVFSKMKFSPYHPYSPYEIKDNVKENIQTLYEVLWERELALQVFDNLPADPNILDIGCGIGVIDMLAYQYLDGKVNVHLLDKDGIKFSSKYYDKDYNFYHSWDSVHDALDTSGFNKEKFTILHPDSVWPVKYDLITSRVSWCWHYPLNTYWDKVVDHLNIGGKLLLNISEIALRDENIIEIISDKFESSPVQFPIKRSNNEIMGYECLWVRKK